MTPEETDHESAGQRVFNLFVVQPAGWLATAIEDLPGLVTKGRDCVSPHLRTAHAVGQLTVAFGAKEMGRKANQLLHRSEEPRIPPTGTGSPTPPTHGEVGLRAEDARVVPIAPTSAPGASSRGVEPPTSKAATTTPAASKPAASKPAASKPAASKAATSKAATSKAAASRGETSKPAKSSGSRPPHTAPGKRATVDLAIPGYDTLSASQVVRRLDGLGEAELEAVRRYESGSRGRRTILNRIAQIRGEPRDQGETRVAPEPPAPGETGAGDERPG